MRIWEVHNVHLGEKAILTTPDGEANVDGLVLTEKAYLLAMRDFRPGQLVEMVRREGPMAAAGALVAHYRSEEMVRANAGRSLELGRGRTPGPIVRRNDEVGSEVAMHGGGG